MGNLLRNLIIILFLALFGFWLFTVIRSCNPTQDANPTLEESVANADETAGEGENEVDLEDLYEVDEADVKAGDMDSGEPTENLDAVGDDLELGEANDPEEDARINTPSSAENNGSTFGNYLVVTGSYLSEGNAEIMHKRLKKKGYHAAEIITFDLSQYYSVTAGRYATLSEARVVARNLKNEGEEAYVHRRRGKKVK